MTTPTVIETRRHGHQIGERVELARYTTSSGARIVLGQRVDGVVRLIDRPASAEGRSFLLERELEQDGNAALRAPVDDYLEQSRVYDEVPMLVSSLPSGLEQLGTGENER